MTKEEIDIIKKSIKELQLDTKYYDDLRKNSISLYEKRKLEYEYQYYEDGAYYDIYNPDAYNVVLYLIHYKDKIYVGNEQIPTEIDIDNKKRTVNMIEYWFRGNNSNYVILHEFIGVNNKSINYRGCGCNQYLLNIIKAKIIEKIKTNLNVNGIYDIDSYELENQYGKTISIYKAKTRKLLKSTPVHDFANNILTIMNDIETNTNIWLNTLYEKNRYWLISEDEQDKKEVKEFLSIYGYGSECCDDELYKAILIIFKEYLLWQTCEKYLGNYSIFNKKAYLMNPQCTAHELYDWKRMWDNSKPINLILSICYKQIHEWKITKDKANYKKFRNNLYKNINNKNNDRRSIEETNKLV